MKRVFTFLACISFGLGVVVATPSVSHALPLSAGEVIISDLGVATEDLGENEDPLTGGTILAHTVPAAAFASDPAGSFTGTLESWVVNDASNPLGGLTFVYRLANDATSTSALERLSIAGFAGWQTDVSYQEPAALFGGVAPGIVTRDPLDGSVIGWDFHPVPTDVNSGFLTPGQASRLMIIQTNAPALQDALAFVINGGIAKVPTFAPVPEPSTLLLGAFGILGLAYAAWRRR